MPAVKDAALGAHGERQRVVPEVDLRPEVVRYWKKVSIGGPLAL